LIGQDDLGGPAVAGDAAPARRSLAALVGDMLDDLGLQRALQQPARQLPQQAVRASDLLRRLSAAKQLVDQLIRELGRSTRLPPGRPDSAGPAAAARASPAPIGARPSYFPRKNSLS